MGFLTQWSTVFPPITPQLASAATLFDTAILVQRNDHNPVGAKQKIVDAINADPASYPQGVTTEMDKLITGIGNAADAGISAWVSWTPPFGGTLSPSALQAMATALIGGWSGISAPAFKSILGQAIWELIMTGA